MPSAFLGNLSQLFTALGLTTVARMLATNVAFTGGTIDGTTVGGTTPAAGSFTNLFASGTLSATGTLTTGQQQTKGTSAAIQMYDRTVALAANYTMIYRNNSQTIFYDSLLNTNQAMFDGSNNFYVYGPTVYVSGNINLTGSFNNGEPTIVNLNGASGPMPITIGDRAAAMAVAGGTLSINSTGGIAWTVRIFVTNLGRNAQFGTEGYFDITMPPNGTTITGYSGASNVMVLLGVIVLPANSTLYYMLPIGAAHSSVSGNFAIVEYTAAMTTPVPPNWMPICTYNGDTNTYFWLAGKYQLKKGSSLDNTSYVTGFAQNVDGGTI